MLVAYDARPLSKNKAGIGQYTKNLLEYIAMNDPAINLILCSNKKIDFEKNQSIRFIEDSNLIWSKNSNLWFQSALPFNLKKNRVDLFHGTLFLTPILSAVPSIITIHDMVLDILPGTMYWKNRLPLKLLMKISAKKAARIIAVSENTKKDIIKFLRIEQEKIKVVYPGVSNNFSPVKKENDRMILNKFKLSPGYILTVGTLEPRKNLFRLICAYKMIAANEGIIPQLVIAGGQGWLKEDINKVVDSLGLRKKVVLIGYVSDTDLPALYRNAIIFVYPSLYEGFGLPNLEAMACGTPVISTNTSSIPEVVGEAGLLVDPYRPDEMARAITDVLRNEELCTRMKRAGITRSVLFSWDKTAQETIKLYHEVIEEKNLKG
jgi:glycosyltransferase involved in cell wall biosynthesis